MFSSVSPRHTWKVIDKCTEVFYHSFKPLSSGITEVYKRFEYVRGVRRKGPRSVGANHLASGDRRRDE